MADVRLIDAIAYYKEPKEEMDYPGRSEEFMIAIDVAIADLADSPTIDAAPVVHGEWLNGYAIQNGKVVYKSIECSVCEEYFKVESYYDQEYWKARFKVCPFCGAKMDLVTDNG